jgi:hypothetical protein
MEKMKRFYECKNLRCLLDLPVEMLKRLLFMSLKFKEEVLRE